MAQAIKGFGISGKSPWQRLDPVVLSRHSAGSWWPHDAPSGVKFERIRPSVASGADGCLELFLVDNGENLWHRRQEAATGDWSQWSSREVPPAVGLVGSPAVAAGAEGRLELFVAGTDGALWHTWQTARNGGWSAWYSHGAPRKFVLLDALATG